MYQNFIEYTSKIILILTLATEKLQKRARQKRENLSHTRTLIHIEDLIHIRDLIHIKGVSHTEGASHTEGTSHT